MLRETCLFLFLWSELEDASLIVQAGFINNLNDSMVWGLSSSIYTAAGDPAVLAARRAGVWDGAIARALDSACDRAVMELLRKVAHDAPREPPTPIASTTLHIGPTLSTGLPCGSAV
jgi:hypothetical protein